MKMRKGFTLIELMIVIAIISIIAAIAIPNLMQSRIRANEATAVSGLKGYGVAQVTFQVGRQGRLGSNGAPTATGYAMNYRNLFYGNPVAGATNVSSGDNLQLISKAQADAFITGDVGIAAAATNGAPTTAPTTATAYQGYHFGSPSDLTSATDYYTTNFALVAAPANSSTTGNNGYWMGTQGTVYFQGLANSHTTPAASYTALAPTPSAGGATAFDGWSDL